MGLFSKFGKNKQDAAGEDSTFYSNADDAAVAAKARSKRAQSAGRAAPDPGLPEKKRARRRLVGAIALALAVAIGLPMVLDSEPKPLASDIAIQIPSKDKLSLTPALSQEAVNNAAVKSAAKETQEQVERAAAEKAAAEQAAADKAAAKPEQAKPEAKLADAPKEKAIEAPKDKVADVPKEKPAELPKDKAVAKVTPEKPAADKHAADKPAMDKHTADKPAADKPVAPKANPEDAARALAILEGKGGDAAGDKFMVRVVALATAERITEVQEKLKGAGFKPATQKVTAKSGDLTRIIVGPYSKDEAEKVRVRLGRMGFNAVQVVPA